MMKIVFLGSSAFAVPALKMLYKNKYRILAVITQPDKKRGRGMRLAETPVKKLAGELGISTFQPDKINSAQTLELFRELAPDLCIVVAYGQIFGSKILEVAQKGFLNLHASLLPKYRGAAPINWALINGDADTGVSLMQVAQKMDAGPVLVQKKIMIEKDDTFLTLEKKLSIEGAELLADCLPAVEAGMVNLLLQDDAQATFAPKLKKENGLIDWEKSAFEITNLIRGCLPWPGAFTYFRQKQLKIIKAGVIIMPVAEVRPSFGKVLSVNRDGIVVLTGDQALLIEELQIEGKRVMKAGEFISGYRIASGEIFKNKNIA